MMIDEEGSPDSEITLRENRSSMPKFSDVETLPTPLRELQRGVNVVATPPRPSELTILANRLGKIHLDATVEGKTGVSGKNEVTPARPLRLDFDDDATDPAQDKENVSSGIHALESLKTRLRSIRQEHEDESLVVKDTTGEDEWGSGLESHLTAKATDEGNVTCKAHDITARSNTGETSAAEETRFVDEGIDEQNGTGVESANAADICDEDTQQVNASAISDGISNQKLTEKCATCVESPVDGKPSDGSIVASEIEQSGGGEDTGGVEGKSPSRTDQKDTLGSKKDSMNKSCTSAEEGDVPALASGTEGRLSGSENIDENPADDKDSKTASEAELATMKERINIILEGKEKWSWQERCEAMSAVTHSVMASPSEEAVSTIRRRLAELASTVNDNLDELRPSIIASAIGLVNAIVECNIDEESKFAEEVFPGVMDLACGRSLTAREAAKSIALMLSFHPDLSTILEDADNPDRLCELLELEANGDVENEKLATRAAAALKIVQASVYKDAPTVPEEDAETSAFVSSIATEESSATSQVSEEGQHVEAEQQIASAQNSGDSRSVSTSLIPESASVSSFLPRANLSSLSMRSTPRHKRISERLEAAIANDVGAVATPRNSVRSRVSELRSSVLRNMKLGETVKRISPGSSRKKRMYTEEEVEEARRAAMRLIMEETAQAHAKERARFQADRMETEKRLRKEQSEVAELKAVLEEYEQTMQKMVSQGNSHASAYASSLEKENKKLKAELLEATEAYESIKERYDTGKQALSVFENKEARFIEQIKDLKKSMAELQKWSNDLKANSEKKLAKAFENVTTYRASYLDKEAHLSKAMSDLERVRGDLQKEASNHAKTAASLARIEASLHDEQDARSSVEASLSTCKASLARVTAQKERLQGELDSTQEELKHIIAELAKLKDADTRASDAMKQLEFLTVEGQSLKARAYDDMTRIRTLESELEEKEKEYEELSSICEEALSQLEKMKVEGK